MSFICVWQKQFHLGVDQMQTKLLCNFGLRQKIALWCKHWMLQLDTSCISTSILQWSNGVKELQAWDAATWILCTWLVPSFNSAVIHHVTLSCQTVEWSQAKNSPLSVGWHRNNTTGARVDASSIMCHLKKKAADALLPSKWSLTRKHANVQRSRPNHSGVLHSNHMLGRTQTDREWRCWVQQHRVSLTQWTWCFCFDFGVLGCTALQKAHKIAQKIEMGSRWSSKCISNCWCYKKWFTWCSSTQTTIAFFSSNVLESLKVEDSPAGSTTLKAMRTFLISASQRFLLIKKNRLHSNRKLPRAAVAGASTRQKTWQCE